MPAQMLLATPPRISDERELIGRARSSARHPYLRGAACRVIVWIVYTI
jgi:hypothetical protein